MKKLLAILTSFFTTSTLATSVVGCDTQWGNYTDIERPEPVYAIRKEGFENFAEDKIDVNRFSYTYDLIDEVESSLVSAGYDLATLKWDIVRNKIQLEEGLEDNLLRNGVYIFTITNTKNTKDKLVIQQKITNSKYLPDVVLNLNIGNIDDNRIKTILMRMIFNNLTLISRIDDIANEMLNSENINIGETSADLNFGSFDKNNKDKFYGQVTLNYKIVPYSPWEGTKDINELAGGDKRNDDLGTWRAEPTRYSVLSQYITRNFATNLQYLAILINDIDIDNWIVTKTETNKYTITLNTISQHSDGYKTYLSGTVKLTLTYYGEFS